VHDVGTAVGTAVAVAGVLVLAGYSSYDDDKIFQERMLMEAYRFQQQQQHCW